MAYTYTNKNDYDASTSSFNSITGFSTPHASLDSKI